MKKGLVLEGGAMRGMYTAGVVDVLMEQNVDFDGVVGVSAGAVFGCNYKSRQIGRTIRYNLKYCGDPRYASFRNFIRTGDIFDEEFCYHKIPNELDPFDIKTFVEHPSEFYVVCTDVHTGEPVYHKCERGDDYDVQWMRASASMPLVSNVVSIDGKEMLDGGISDSIPITWFRNHGYQKNLVVLTRPAGYRKKKQAMLGIYKVFMRKYPAVHAAMARRHEDYNQTLDELERLKKEGNTLVMCPSKDLGVKRMENDPKKLQALYDLGRQDAMDMLDEIRKFLSE